MAIGKSKENTESVSNSRGKDIGIIKILHATASGKTSFVFNNGSRTVVALDLILPRVSNDAHWRKKSDKVPIAFRSERKDLHVGGEKPMGIVRALHNLFV